MLALVPISGKQRFTHPACKEAGGRAEIAVGDEDVLLGRDKHGVVNLYVSSSQCKIRKKGDALVVENVGRNPIKVISGFTTSHEAPLIIHVGKSCPLQIGDALDLIIPELLPPTAAQKFRDPNRFVVQLHKEFVQEEPTALKRKAPAPPTTSFDSPFESKRAARRDGVRFLQEDEDARSSDAVTEIKRRRAEVAPAGGSAARPFAPPAGGVHRCLTLKECDTPEKTVEWMMASAPAAMAGSSKAKAIADAVRSEFIDGPALYAIATSPSFGDDYEALCERIEEETTMKLPFGFKVSLKSALRNSTLSVSNEGAPQKPSSSEAAAQGDAIMQDAGANDCDTEEDEPPPQNSSRDLGTSSSAGGTGSAGKALPKDEEGEAEGDGMEGEGDGFFTSGLSTRTSASAVGSKRTDVRQSAGGAAGGVQGDDSEGPALHAADHNTHSDDGGEDAAAGADDPVLPGQGLDMCCTDILPPPSPVEKENEVPEQDFEEDAAPPALRSASPPRSHGGPSSEANRSASAPHAASELGRIARQIQASTSQPAKRRSKVVIRLDLSDEEDVVQSGDGCSSLPSNVHHDGSGNDLKASETAEESVQGGDESEQDFAPVRSDKDQTSSQVAADVLRSLSNLPGGENGAAQAHGEYQDGAQSEPEPMQAADDAFMKSEGHEEKTEEKKEICLEEDLLDKVFSGIQNMGEAESLETDAPEGSLSVPLKKHQKQALGWMLKSEERRNENSKYPAGGILADAQGLGKSLSVIAVIVSTLKKEVERATSREQAGGKTNCSCRTSKKKRVKCEMLDDSDSDSDATQVQCSVCKDWMHAVCEVKNRLKRPKLMHSDDYRFICKTCSKRASSSHPIYAPHTTLIVCPTSIAGCILYVPRRFAELKRCGATLARVVHSDGSVTFCMSRVRALEQKQWEEEIEDKAPDLRVCLYYGKDKKLLGSDPALFLENHVVITTYGLVNSEGPVEGENGVATSGGPLFKVNWRRVVLDEAHIIRNLNTKQSKACLWLGANTFWCLSGTPIVNKLGDLEAYTTFIDDEQKYQWLSLKIRELTRGTARSVVENNNLLKQIHEMLKPILLRRTKTTMLDGQLILDLPKKVILVKNELVLSEREKDLYQKLETGTLQSFKNLVEDGYKKNMISILALLLRLRQFCDHPNLLPPGLLESCDEEDVDPLAIKPESDAQPSSVRGTSNKLVRLATAAYAHSSPAGGGIGIKEDPDRLKGTAETLAEMEMLDDDCLGGPALAPSSRVFEGVSTKLQAVLDETSRMISEQSDVKILIFSVFPSFFVYLSKALKDINVKHMQIDGSLTMPVRAGIIKKFKTDPSISVMLLSTQTCSLGLNLTCATRCLIVDPWWNAAWEEQATDRCHRMGQTKDVEVVKFIIAGTVEERMYKIQTQKSLLAERALGEGGGSSNSKQRLSLADLRSLFGANLT